MNNAFPPELIGKKYNAAVTAFARQLGDPNLRLDVTQECDAYFRRCALGVWKHSGAEIDSDYVDTYNMICSGDHQPPRALFFEVAAGTAGAPAFRAPGFFSAMMASDRLTGKNRTGQFIELVNLLLSLFGAVDGKLTSAETDYIAACVELLKQEADGQHPTPVEPKAPKAPQNPDQPPVTPAAGGQNGAAAPTAGGDQSTEAAPAEEEPTVEELLAGLDELCGLDRVKKDVRSLMNLIKIRNLRKENSLPVPNLSLHLVFMGNPGTGKTTVARMLAKLYKAIGVLPKGQLVEVDRSGLVAGYIGQTALKTQEVINKAMGGILFVDEAYALAHGDGGNDFGQEAIDTILKAMEDHRDELVVIVAGYQEPMARFLSSNPGLESRFNKYFYFDDYNGDQLNSIFESLCKKNGYTPDETLKAATPSFFTQVYDNRDENFGNARDVRNLFEKMVTIHSDRVVQLENPTKEDLMTFTLEDLRVALEEDDSPLSGSVELGLDKIPTPTLTLEGGDSDGTV